MARLILTQPGEDVFIGGSVDVIGTSAVGEVITVVQGTVTLDPSFNLGGDTVDLPGNAGTFQVRRDGSNAVITGNNISVTIPFGNEGVDVRFDDVTLKLRIDNGQTVLGGQVVTSTATQINVTPPQAAETPLVAEASGSNGTTATAQAISRASLAVADNDALFDDGLPTATIDGAISTNGDVDVFAITLQKGERLILDVDQTSGNLDAVVRIYDPTGQAYGYGDDTVVDIGSAVDYSPSQTWDSLVTFRAPESGTYYFSIESYGPGIDDGPGSGTSSGTYKLNVSIGPVATEEQILQEDVEALISGLSWPSTQLSYAFPNETGDYSIANEDDYVGFAQFTAAQQNAATQLLQQIANVTNLTFTLRPDGQESTATLRYAMSTAPEAAYAYYPGGLTGGTGWFNQDDFNNPVPGNYAWMGILHETGHMLGLKHGHEFPAISFLHDSVEYSVMTYRSFVGDSLNGGYTNETWGYPQTLMMLDIAALQQLYGADFGFNAGNTTYTWSPTTGQMSVNGVAGLLPGNGAATANRVFMTIWDGNGTDTYDLSNYTNAVTIDLRPGHWTTTSATQLANLGLGNRAEGNVANALLFEGDPRSLIENAIGGSGNDILIANQAANRLTGNSGADRFTWESAGDAGIGALADIITDLGGTDLIDLSAIDAVAGGTDNAFQFIGSAAFHNVAGELRFQTEGGNVRVQADIDGNGAADFEIVVNNMTSLQSNDFIL